MRGAARVDVRASGYNEVSYVMADELMEIPLFPLSLVLFPGMVQPLHIFEPRYIEMTRRALDCHVAFGITLALPGSVFEHEIPARVGSIARILDYQRLPNGRYNLLTVGARRFETLETFHDQAYLRARVRLLREEVGSGAAQQLALTASALLNEYLSVVAESDSEGTQKGIEIPDDPIELSYCIAIILPCEDAVKQELLEAETADDRLARAIELLRIETARARDVAAEESTMRRRTTGD